MIGLIKAVIFDFDGLIFDSETYMFESMRQVFLYHQLNLTIEEWCNKCINNPDKYDAYTYFQERLGESINRNEIGRLHEREYLKLINSKNSRPGVLEYLQRSKALGIKVGLATNNTRQWVDMHLKKLNLSKYFDYICTVEDVEEKKPNPEPYLKVLKELNVDPRDAIAFEDSPDGAKSAINANIFCVVVPNEVTKLMEFRNGDYDLIIESMENLSLDGVFIHFKEKLLKENKI